MAHVNLLKQFKTGNGWVLKSIARKPNGQRDWSALPDGSYFIEWREGGKRMRLPAGRTVSQALEAQHIKLAELAATEVGILQRYKPSHTPDPEPMRLSASIRRYLDQIDTLKKPNTYRKYNAVLTRFDKQFPGRALQEISIEELNEFVIKLRKSGLSANTVLHNVIIVAQFCRRNGRPNLTRELQLPAAIHFLPKVYSEEQQSRFLVACDSWERALFSTFLFTGFREQEVMYLFWKDLNPKLRTVRVLSKPDLKFFPKRWEEREVPVPVELAELLENHPITIDSPFVFPSPTGNREQNFLRRCKLIAERAGLGPEEFDLKTFRSTYATSMLRRGFDVRTVQHWMGHKSLETTMRYLAPAPDVHDRLDLIRVPGARKREINRKPPSSEGRLRNAPKAGRGEVK
jgi:integrase/recombinase XerD